MLYFCVLALLPHEADAYLIPRVIASTSPLSYGQVLGRKKRRPYIPDFKLAFEHFCIHTGWVLSALPVQCQSAALQGLYPVVPAVVICSRSAVWC